MEPTNPATGSRWRSRSLIACLAAVGLLGLLAAYDLFPLLFDRRNAKAEVEKAAIPGADWDLVRSQLREKGVVVSNTIEPEYPGDVRIVALNVREPMLHNLYRACLARYRGHRKEIYWKSVSALEISTSNTVISVIPMIG